MLVPLVKPARWNEAIAWRFLGVRMALLSGLSELNFSEMAQSRTDELRQRALQLPADERLALATELLDSVEGPEDAEWAAAWAAELDRRLRELDSGSTKTIPWEQVKAEIQARLRSR